MKTKKEIAADLYNKVKLNHSIAIAMYIMFGICILVDIIARIQGYENHFDIASGVVGTIFPLIFSCIVGYYLFFPSNVKKEKEEMMRLLEKLRSEKKQLEELVLAEAQNRNPETHYLNLSQKTQEKIWELELRLNMLGEKIEQE